jgi:hypothetical protein
MWKLATWFILAAACGRTQGLLLPQSRHIVGIVADSDGKPVAEARIDHANDRRQAHQTDSEGRFELDTDAPSVVISKAGFRSELVRTQDQAEVQVTLQRLTVKQTFPSCSNTIPHVGIDGWGARFEFPVTSGITASRQGQDVDYGVRSYYVDTKSGPKGIRHGSGPMWSFGLPNDQGVWRSVKFQEIAYDFRGLMILDARGQLPNGDYWRYLGKFGESASYFDADQDTANVLDKFLDGACLTPKSRP